MLASLPHKLSFDEFTLDTVRCVLLRGALELPLRRQSFEVLRYFAERAGKVVTSDELIEALWSAKPADHNASVGQCIKEIRRAMGHDARWIIKTVSGRGYEFMAEVVPFVPPRPEVTSLTSAPPAAAEGKRVDAIADAAAGEGEPLAALASERPWWRPNQLLLVALSALLVVGVWMLGPWKHAAAPRSVLTMMATPSIAVLPFKAISEERDQSDAIALTDDITTELSRTPRGYTMRIRSAPGYKARVEHPRDVGRELGVRYLVLGSVRREGDVRQVNIQLIEAESSRLVWAEPIPYPTEDPGAQNRVAARIARMLPAQVLRAESRLPLPAHPEAGHFVILGRSLMSGERGVEANRQAIAYFDKARTLDTNSVPALLGYGRSRVNQVLNRWVPKEQWNALLEEAEGAIKQAVSLDSREPGLHVLRGAYLRARGKDAEAIAAFEHALYLNPNYPLAHAELGRAKIEVGLAGETVGHIEEAVRLSPTDPYLAGWYYWAGMAEVHVERYKSAVDWLLKARQANRAYPHTVIWLAVAYAWLDNMEEARAYFEEHLTNVPHFSISSWNRALPRRNETVAAQRARIVATLCRLGAPGCEVAPGSAR